MGFGARRTAVEIRRGCCREKLATSRTRTRELSRQSGKALTVRAGLPPLALGRRCAAMSQRRCSSGSTPAPKRVRSPASSQLRNDSPTPGSGSSQLSDETPTPPFSQPKHERLCDRWPGREAECLRLLHLLEEVRDARSAPAALLTPAA